MNNNNFLLFKPITAKREDEDPAEDLNYINDVIDKQRKKRNIQAIDWRKSGQKRIRHSFKANYFIHLKFLCTCKIRNTLRNVHYSHFNSK